MEEIPISELMTESVHKVTAKTFIKKVVMTMRDNKLSCLVVCHKDEPIGMITNSDLMAVLANSLDKGIDKKLRAESIMSSPPMVFNKDMSAFEALFLAQTQDIKHLPIVNSKNKLCGVVTPAELLKNNYRLIESQYELKKLINSNNNSKDQNVIEFPSEDRDLHIGNHHFMKFDLQFTHELSLRYDRPYSIILIEMDYYKPYCDHYGLAKGTRVLKQLVDKLKQSIRGSDRIYRYKEATLFILLPETDLESANLLADRLVRGLAGLAIPNIKSKQGVVTVSAGVSSEEPAKYKDIEWTQHLERADDALMAAKEMGRNQTAINTGNAPVYTNTIRLISSAS